MKMQNQILLVALAVVFAIALALTIAIICIAVIQREESDTGEELVYPPEWTQPFISNEPIATLPIPNVTETTETTFDPGNGLSYESNRNGTCTLVGIGSCAENFIIIPEHSPHGDTVTAIAPKALIGCETATAIQIPETVVSIGELAFAGCSNLVYISVSKYNPFYCDIDGVLYTKGGGTLLLYPPMHTGSSLYLSSTVYQIADMAFYQCAYLSSIRYEGTAEQWHLIDIGVKNYSLTAASVIFSSRAEA